MRRTLQVDISILNILQYDSVGVYVKPVTPVINGLTSFVVAVVNMATDREKVGLVDIQALC